MTATLRIVMNHCVWNILAMTMIVLGMTMTTVIAATTMLTVPSPDFQISMSHHWTMVAMGRFVSGGRNYWFSNPSINNHYVVIHWMVSTTCYINTKNSCPILLVLFNKIEGICVVLSCPIQHPTNKIQFQSLLKSIYIYIVHHINIIYSQSYMNSYIYIYMYIYIHINHH